MHFCSEKSEVHHREESGPTRTAKVVESLLLNAERESERISNRHFPGTILQIPPDRPDIRNQELGLCVVIHVVPLSSGKEKRALHGPARVCAKLESGPRQEGLRDG